MAPVPFRVVPSRVAALTALLLLAAGPAHALRVATYNVLDYRTGTLAGRQANLRTIFAGLNPDLLICQEMNELAAKDSFLTNVLNVTQPGEWTGTWLQLQSSPTVEGGAIFWKPAKVAVSNITSVATGGPRQVLVGLVKPVGYLTNPGWFRIYSVHLKAGVSDSTTRRVECTSLRTTLNNQVTTVVGTNFLIGGDTNFYGADVEGGYIRLLENQLDNDGRAFDPFSMPGHWNSNSAYTSLFTQCPCVSCITPGQSGGGLDDRFDLFVTSQSVQDGAGLDLVPATYLAYGNDGQHFNTDINGGGFNTAVGLTIANALHDASDHIPVLLQLQLPARVSAASQVPFGSVIVGAAGVTQDLSVTNTAPVPGEALGYTLTAPAGFTAPGGSFNAAAGAPANLHALGLDASTPGAKSGTLTIASNAPDSASKPVQLSATVLAHAVASLDSGTVVTAGLLDFGMNLAGGFVDQGVRVHDQGWNALQAQLAVTAADVTGGAGRFSLVGFAPATFGQTGRTFNVHFDDTGATLDSTYDATLTFTTADQALPGAIAASPLTLDLHARVLSHTDGVDRTWSLHFSPPRPNPARSGTEIAFELAHDAPVELAVFDLSGRRIASLADGVLGAGPHTLRWNAQDDAGRRVPAGLYFVRFTTPGLARVARVALLP